MSLVGLAFSGGGVRSATFNLGVLQGLADTRLLRIFDYLSTVSGGGYIGSWLGTWVKRAGSLERVEQQLRPSRVVQAQGRVESPRLPTDAEPEPIYHLRSYSSYLTPRRGLFSADSWVLVAIYLRNILLNQLVLLPLVMVLLLAPRLLVPFYSDWGEAWDKPVLLSAIFTLAIALVSIGVSIHWMSTVRQRRPPWKVRIQTGIRMLHALILLPLLVFAQLVTWQLSWDFYYNSLFGQSPRWQPILEKYLPWDLQWLKSLDPEGTLGFGNHLAWIVLLGSWAGGPAALVYVLLGVVFGEWRRFGVFCRKALFVLLSGFVAGMLYYVFFGIAPLDNVYGQKWDVAIMATAGPPLVLLVIVLGTYFAVGLFGKDVTEDVREWWASLCGWLLIYGLLWVAIVGASLLGPPLLVWVGGWAQAALASTWVTTAVAGVLAGKSPKTNGGQRIRMLGRLALLAPPVFIGGLFLFVSLLVAAMLNNWPAADNPLAYFEQLTEITFWPVSAWVAVCLMLALFMAWRVDVNLFSLHGTYTNRLVRCSALYRALALDQYGHELGRGRRTGLAGTQG